MLNDISVEFARADDYVVKKRLAVPENFLYDALSDADEENIDFDRVDDTDYIEFICTNKEQLSVIYQVELLYCTDCNTMQ